VKKILPSKNRQLAWLHALSTSDQYPSMDDAVLREASKKYINHYQSPWLDVMTSQDFPVPRSSDRLDLSTVDRIAIYLQELLDRYISRIYWGYNRQKVNQLFWDMLIKEIDIHTFPNTVYNGIISVSTDVRVMPTELPIYPAENSYMVDHFQLSQISFNTPVKVLHTAQSRKWLLIVSGQVFGWVKSAEVAKIRESDQAIWLSQENWAVMLDDTYPVTCGGNWYFSTRIGQVFPVSSDGILIHKKMSSGYAKMLTCHVPTTICQEFPCRIDHDVWFALIQKFLFQPYGWGDVYGLRDCSRLIVDLYACFGIWLPRLSFDQANLATVVTIPVQVDHRKDWIVKYCRPGESILYMPGHVVLYMGEVDGEAIILQTILGPKNSGYIIGESALMSLDFDSGLGDHYATFLNRITRVIGVK